MTIYGRWEGGAAMLAQGEIKKLATKLQTQELNVRREFVQHQFLRFFYQQPGSEKVFFKGGTALRIIYHSPRFSEDLDFGSTLDTSSLEGMILATMEMLGKDGIEIEIVESKQTSGGYLGIVSLDKLATNLEISSRTKPNGRSTTIISDFTAPYIVYTLNQNDLVLGKITALLFRQKPRDFYDIYFLLRAGMLSIAHKNKLKEVLALAKKTQIDFASELKIFLPKSHWPIIANFKDSLIRELERNI